MKTWKLVSGVLTIVFSFLVLLQSCAAGFVNSVEQSGDAGGSAGLIVAVMMLAGGIVAIATRKSTGKGGNITLIVLFALASIVAFPNSKVYQDLKVWGIWCLINLVIAIIAMRLKKPKTVEMTSPIEKQKE